MDLIYRAYPWNMLVKYGSIGVSTTEYGRKLMKEMMLDYNHQYYAKLVSDGYAMLANAYEADLKYDIYCPAILICGDKDKAGYTKKYNKCWANKTGLSLFMIENAGHNSNSDKPEIVNQIIEEFIDNL